MTILFLRKRAGSRRRPPTGLNGVGLRPARKFLYKFSSPSRFKVPSGGKMGSGVSAPFSKNFFCELRRVANGRRRSGAANWQPISRPG